ncbi:MAG: SMI1/KNR4 family protein [Thermogutta sp.]|uniref:hypothetical protein n=1 Tax=Thermogutta sp. TaxID=1962930 RepID=UPI0019925A93|nr:hypothetical protein [Thermogutta sp.]MBC7351479.1 SMI1/KNR4 family protein [Thermogutta sp.]
MSLTDLLAIAGQAIAAPLDRSFGPEDHLRSLSHLAEELAALLHQRNGFFAYQSALLVRPLSHERPPLGVIQWNEAGLWKEEYHADLGEVIFFAEDVFGNQFAIRSGGVWFFDAETGDLEFIAESLDEWARLVVGNPEYWTGYPLLQQWQAKHGTLPAGERLAPKLPFVLGGGYEVENLYSVNDVEGMRFRGSLARQIRDVPDGAQIRIKLIHRPPQNDAT